MSNKKKIVILISIISIMILCFSICTYAASYTYGIELHDGDIITFKDILTDIGDTVIYLNFHDTDVPSIIKEEIYKRKVISSGREYIYLAYKNGGINNVYTYDNPIYDDQDNTWYLLNAKSITVYGDQTITDENAIKWLYDNTVSGLPTPPHLEPSFWETVSGFFSEALDSGTAIVNWMTITPIALIPLALYCLIVIIAIIRRMIKG